MNKRLLKRCLRIARRNNTPKKHPEWGSYHHFSFLIQGNTIIGWATNRGGSGVALTQFGYRKTSKRHSETEVYRKVKGIMDHTKSFIVINIRLNRQDELRMSCPCDNCYNFLSYVGCKTIWFSTPTGFNKMRIEC